MTKAHLHHTVVKIVWPNNNLSLFTFLVHRTFQFFFLSRDKCHAGRPVQEDRKAESCWGPIWCLALLDMVPLALHCPLTTSWPSLTCSPLLHNSFPLHCCPRPLLGILLDMEALHCTLYGSTAFNCSFAIWQHCCIYSLLYVDAANALKSPGIQCGILLLCSTTPTITSSTRRSVCLACSAADKTLSLGDNCWLGGLDLSVSHQSAGQTE